MILIPGKLYEVDYGHFVSGSVFAVYMEPAKISSVINIPNDSIVMFIETTKFAYYSKFADCYEKYYCCLFKGKKIYIGTEWKVTFSKV